MPRTWFVCLTIVAAFSSPLFASAPSTVLVPVSGAVLAVARTWNLEPSRDRVRFLPELVRLTQSAPEQPGGWSATLRRDASLPGGPDTGETAVVPLDAAVWSAAVFKRPVSAAQLLTTILLDRNAALLAAGLAALDDETLAYLARSPLLLGDLYRQGAGPFAAFAASLRVRGGRIAAPGEESDQRLWAAVVGAPLDAPERFARLLFTSAAGRLAYLYGTVSLLEPATQRFVMGTPAEGRHEETRVARLRALAALATSSYSEWKLEAFPYSRPLNDLALLWLRLRVDDAGVPLPPGDRAFWADVWELPESVKSDGLTAAEAGPGPAALDALWLAAAVSTNNMFTRGDRLDQLAFAQRVFGNAPGAAADIVTVVRAFPRQRMLMLTLERMGLRTPALYAFVSRQAQALTPPDATRAHAVMAQLQPALALLSKLVIRGTLPVAVAERLVRSLFTVPLDHDHYAGAMARWIGRELAPRLPAADDLDTRVLLGLAGPPLGPRAREIEWEGERYRLDLSLAEMRRLGTIRGKQGGPTLTLALALELWATRLDGVTVDTASDLSRGLQALMAQHAPALASSLTAADFVATGVTMPRPHREVLDRIDAEIVQALRVGDLRRAAKQARPLREVVDLVLGQALLSLAYAVDFGDPQGPALLSRNAALRHDFGVGRAAGDIRSRLPWAVPRQDFQPGVAWHVTGSALGLDIALARLALRRIDADRIANAPRITSIDREGFAVSHALLDASRLHDDTRDAIAAALHRGAATVAAAAGDRPAIDRLADRLSLSALRRRSLVVASEATPNRLSELLSLTELLELGGGPPPAALAPWGAGALALSGCPCTQLVSPRTWPLLTGRAQVPYAAASIPDLNLRIAAGLAELGLPAQLAPAVLSAAIPEFLEDATPSDGGDWWGLARAARALTRERIEDYVAAAAGIGGALTLDAEESKEP